MLASFGPATACIVSSTSPRGHIWVIDSSCSHHMAPIYKNFSSHSAYPVPHPVVLADGSTIDSVGEGTVALTSIINGNKLHIVLQWVLHVFILKNSHIPMASTAHASGRVTLDLMHKHLGHPNYATLHRMINKGLVKGVIVHDPKGNPTSVCDACMR